MTKVMQMGDKVRLSELSKLSGHIKINLNWRLLPELKNPPEGDMFAFMRDKNNIAPTNEDFIFFNNMQSQGETAVLTAPVITSGESVEGSQSLILHLGDMRYEILEILAGFNLYRADERDQSLRFIESLTLTICLDDNTPLVKYECPLEAHKASTGLTMLALRREGGDWEVEIVDHGYHSFNDLARENGIVVSG